MKPTRYVVEYLHQGLLEKEGARAGGKEFADIAYYLKEADFDTLEMARAFLPNVSDAVIYERRNIRDVTPEGDPSGLLWDYETESVEEGSS